jgi:hypothetical protein
VFWQENEHLEYSEQPKLVMTSITVVSAMHANATGSNQKRQLKTASLNVLKAF